MSGFVNHSLKIHTLSETPAVTVGTMTNLGHQPNSTVTAPETGDVFNVANVMTSQQPTMPWGTLALKTILDLIPTIGKCIDNDGTHPGVAMFGQSLDACQASGRGAAGTHLEVVAPQGHIVIDQISVEKGGFAVITGMVHGLSADGSAYPFTEALNANLPASPIVDELFGLGKAELLGTTVDRILSVNVAYNSQIEKSDDADSIWPTVLDVLKVPLVVTIVTEDPAWLDPGVRIEFEGSQATHANTNINFLKHAYNAAPVSGGSFEDFAGIVHIQGTLAGLVHVTDHYGASGNAKGQTSIEIAPIEAAGVAPIVWDTTAAYTL